LLACRPYFWHCTADERIVEDEYELVLMAAVHEFNIRAGVGHGRDLRKLASSL